MEPIEISSTSGRKQAIYFGVPARPLFGFYHPPREGSWRGVGVLLCSPIGTDQTRCERAYRRLAERLSAAGFACLRFDPFGTEDSGGDLHAPGLVRAWFEDLGLATDELKARSGATGAALVGLRVGATLAMAHAAERGPVDSLVLWSPCLSGASFVREVTGLHKIYARMEPQMAAAPPSPANGQEALGTFLPQPLIDDLSKVDLLAAAKRPARRTLVIDPGNLPGREPLMAKLGDLDAAPVLRAHPGHKFLITVPHSALVPDEIIDSIVGWLSEAHPMGTAPVAPVARPLAAPPFGERPLLFGGRRQLFGILTPGVPARKKTNRPGILLTNAGSVNRAGPHRAYVKMARRWADLGYDVLRIDLSGIGDSPPMPGVRENLTYPPTALEELGLAIEALGSPSVIIAGLCSGGDYAFQLGAHSPKVSGAWLLNPRTFCVLDLAAVEAVDGSAPPTNSVGDVPRTLREMAERGVDTLLVVSRNDPGIAYVDARAAADMRALEKLSRFQRVDLDGSDHTFTPAATQERVSNLLTEHLVARY